MLINGQSDDTVPADVTATTAGLYNALLARCPGQGEPARVNNVEGMPHTMPTDTQPGSKACNPGAPYIADCDYWGAANMLSYLHHRAVAPTGEPTANEKNLFRFNQFTAFGRTRPRGTMHEFGYIYVPDACRQGQTCALHIALHGCHQNQDMINDGSVDPSRKYLFARDAGYNDFAERNNIVVLYPQADKTSMLGGNPNGCWDWWGYNGTGYWQKDAVQIRNIWAIVEKL